MKRIQLLSPQEALKIAAGEVIERPAHVIKELIENCLDAQATKIDVYIEAVGKKLIRVVDNGTGMDVEDARICFLPHATSKISTLHDLETVASFGFRGEALASISAISKVVLITKAHQLTEDSLGIKITYSESTITQETLVACASGTDIQINDLFYNTPVRKKFLKQDETEWNAIQQIIHAFCLSAPHVHFRLYNNTKLVLNAPPVTTIQARASQIWDVDVAKHLIALSENQDERYLISGYISDHNFWRYNRQQIYFFVNNRWVKNSELSKGVFKGYLNVLPTDKFPVVIISVTIPPHYIDVNIHPKKEEVKFLQPGIVQNILTRIIKNSLEANLSKKLTTFSQPAHFSIDTKSSVSFPALPESLNKHTVQLPPLHGDRNHNFAPIRPPFAELFNVTPFINPTHQTAITPLNKEHCKILGQLFYMYILIERDDEIVFIDQHAAHERIMYEKYCKKFAVQEGTKLLFPETVSLDQLLIEGLVTHKVLFDQCGIDFDIIGATNIVIRTAPSLLKGPSLTEFITTAAHFIQENRLDVVETFTVKFNEHLHAQMACKSAIKAGDILTNQQMQQLVNDLQKADNRFICAHGRPTTWSVYKNDLEKHFKRC